jgi:hypothetical protein
MKRCPTCKRVETDEALKFCRVDGTTLVIDSLPLNSEAGTARWGSAANASEIDTSILPATTDANIARPTAATAVLPNARITHYEHGLDLRGAREAGEALQIIKQLEEMSGPSLSEAAWIAKIYAALNEKEQGLTVVGAGLGYGRARGELLQR